MSDDVLLLVAVIVVVLAPVLVVACLGSLGYIRWRSDREYTAFLKEIRELEQK